MTQTTLLDNRFFILHVERTNNFGKVFFGLDTCHNPPRNCVIKVYNPIAQKPQLRGWIAKEFYQEAVHLKQASLVNQYLPEIYAYFHNSQAYYIVRESVEGATLEEKVKNTGTFSPEMVREILLKLLLVLDNLHQQKIIHQNIQPKNIILRHSDLAPVSINFGNIEQIVRTFDFHGEQNIFSLNDTHSYAPSEQVLDKSIPASDLYSLGLTAIYLLTARNPVDLAIDLDSGNYIIPSKIKDLDSDLAAVIVRAINLDPKDRYSSAKEMLIALLKEKTQTFLSYENPTNHLQNHSLYPKKAISKLTQNKPLTTVKVTKKTSTKSLKNSYIQERKRNNTPKILNWGIMLIIIIGGLYLINRGVSTWQGKENSTQEDSFRTKLPESSLSLPSTLSNFPETSSNNINQEKPSTKKPSLLNSDSSDLLEIPIFTTGTNKKQLRKILGEPNAIQKGYWPNSSAWIYKDLAKGSIDLGYLFDLNTDKLRQTEVAIAPAVGLETIKEILDSLLQGKLTDAVALELQSVYLRQTNTYLFKLENLEGSIERDRDDNIYIGVWEADFH
ncbi:serine/threonine protein kinase [Hyella patelloides]|uniref:serine/threonine protein kinase n=1 Tax=Hyella patelloides TaxID=1982969 RepID=UPI0016439F60|nr:protein kinase [Hyella patelloides]